MSDKVRQLFEYLLEVNNLRAKVVRNFKEYDKNWTKASLEEFGDGVYLMGSGNDKEAILEIHRQKFTEEILTPPHPDKSIREWITYSYNKENNPPEIPNPKVVIQGSDKLEIRFEEDPRRIKLFNDWKAAWKDWADSISKMEKVQTLYELFFKINQDFQIEGEGLELMLGKTIFTWKTEVDPILHPLFTTKMDIELDTDKGIIIVKPTNQGFKLELNIFSGIPLPNIEEIQNIGRIARYRDVFEEDMNDLSTQFMQVIDASGRTALEDEPLIASKDAIGHLNEYVIVLRRKDNQVLQKDLEQIIESLQEEEFKVPATVESIVGHEFLTDKDLNNNNWGRVATDLYFPLASNENQKEIARRLASNYGLTVQGPPGTGKTHTIANLVSHLLAHGKKILITSQKESPLKVLKEKIPSEIRDLCVPVLGGGRDSLKEIETSIRTISDKLGNTTIEKLEAEITKNKEELEDSRRKEAKLKHQLMAYSKNEKTEIEYKGNFISKANTAQILTDESVDYHWILDKVELNSKFPISEEEFRTFWELRGKLEEKDLYLKDIVLPNIQLIKTTEEMKRWLSNGKNLKHKYDNAIFHTNKIKFPHDKSYTEKINNQLLRILQYKEFFKEGTVHQQILDDYIAGGSRKERWTSFFSSIKVLNKEMLTIYNSIVNHQITLPNKPAPI
ncbi:AAA domain-containing protein [Micrococcus luteus]|uniref:AAA domain-containing protein n=1 Tax=Micrococcus luteus TaxID=1270 RepID=UPI0033CB84B5